MQGAAQELQRGLDALASVDGDADWTRLDALVDRWRAPVVSGETDRGSRRTWASTVLTLLQQTGPAHAMAADRPASRLDDLRAAVEADPGDDSLREMLAAGLVSVLMRAWETDDSAARNLTLSELRHLSDSTPQDVGVRDLYAKALLVSTLEARKANQTWMARTHLEALRGLVPALSPGMLETLRVGLPDALRGAAGRGGWTAHLPWIGKRAHRG